MKVQLPYKVEVTKEEIEEHKDFLEQRCVDSATLYKRRGMFRESDIYNGLIGELAAFKILSKQYEMISPDTTIYEQNKKSHAEDLITKDGKKKFHLKCQDRQSQKLYGPAWVFEKNNAIFKGKKKDEYAVFCVSSLNRMKGEITLPDIVEVLVLSIVQFGDIQELLQDEERMLMDIPYMRKYKNVIRLSEIPKEFK